MAESPDKRCKKKDSDKVKAKEACPSACGTCPEQCEDSTSWYAKKSKRDCEYVAEDPAKRCKKKDSESKVKGKEACPLACGTCAAFSLPEVVPNACGDSASWFVRENPSRDCAYVAKKASGRCDKKDDFGVPASEACAAACGSCLGGVTPSF